MHLVVLGPILAFYRRFFPIQKIRIATYILDGIIANWCIKGALIGILNCTPVSYNWDRTQPSNHYPDPITNIIAISIPEMPQEEDDTHCNFFSSFGIL